MEKFPTNSTTNRFGLSLHSYARDIWGLKINHRPPGGWCDFNFGGKLQYKMQIICLLHSLPVFAISCPLVLTILHYKSQIVGYCGFDGDQVIWSLGCRETWRRNNSIFQESQSQFLWRVIFVWKMHRQRRIAQFALIEVHFANWSSL